MARYIDAEKCPCKGCGITYCNENCKRYYAWLDGCDYDVEAVVEKVRCDCYTMGLDESQAEILVDDIRNGGRE